MEDAHTHILGLKEDPEASFFGVYDGHGGSKIASHVSKNLHKVITQRPEYKENDYKNAIIQGFLELDEKMKHEESLKDDVSGSTAITALMKDNKFYVGNVGDSRCLVCVNGEAEALSVDHKPSDESEKKRIVDAGGFVEMNRVNGNLALSRALGDFGFKGNPDVRAEDQIISACPDVVTREISCDWQFVVLACDGIWDVLSNQEVADFVVARLAKGLQPEVICEELMTRCLANDCSMGGLGCDNMTVILICFLHNQPYKNLVDKCQAIVTKKENARTHTMEEVDLNATDKTEAEEEKELHY